MELLKNRRAVVTGGSRGLGLGLVEALVAEGAEVTVVARDRNELEALKARLGVTIVPADVTEDGIADRVLSRIRPDILALNAGAVPPMGALTEISWEDFSRTWNVDVKAGLAWMKAALTLPLAPGSRVLVASSGAAIGGSPLSGGYAGAKRMLWTMAKYANGLAGEKQLGIRFQTIVPMQMVAGTGVGEQGASAYASKRGITAREFFAANYPAPFGPADFGRQLVSVLTDPRYHDGMVFGLKGGQDILPLDEAA